MEAREAFGLGEVLMANETVQLLFHNLKSIRCSADLLSHGSLHQVDWIALRIATKLMMFTMARQCQKVPRREIVEQRHRTNFHQMYIQVVVHTALIR